MVSRAGTGLLTQRIHTVLKSHPEARHWENDRPSYARRKPSGTVGQVCVADRGCGCQNVVPNVLPFARYLTIVDDDMWKNRKSLSITI